jgi:hypothetical protein
LKNCLSRILFFFNPPLSGLHKFPMNLGAMPHN